MLGFGDPLQYSVFLCELSRAERALMEMALRRTVLSQEDSVIVVDLGPARGMASNRIAELGVSRIRRPERGLII
jgi:CRISPR-associated protein Cas2